MSDGPKTFDCIVLGFGGVGSSALYFAAKKGWEVVGIDRFGTAHASGSSHGQTRIIRTAYFEHPDYVPLARRSFELWDEIQAQTTTELIKRTGLLQTGDPGGEVIQGLKKSVSEHDLDVEFLSPAEIGQRFPVLKIPESMTGIFEHEAGYLRVELCVASWVKRAVEAGAAIRTDSTVTSWEVDDDGTISVIVSSADGEQTLKTRRLIVAAGAWSDRLIPEVQQKLQIIRKQQHWFQLDRIDIKAANRFPCFFIENDNGCFYGFPEIDYLGMKFAEHSGGELLDSPDEVNREINDDDLSRVEEFIDGHFEHTRKRLVHFSQCLYTRSPDEHFIIDNSCDHGNVVFAAGLSGHGFKFAPAIGQRLVGMLEGDDDQLFEFLRVGDRFQTA